MHELGEIRRVNVRKRWPHEQSDFTPWLADEKNMKLLADAVGLELEVENTEVAVGPYSADILAKDPGTDRYVVIENQFGKTNHDHLGKLITYGSVLDASAIVWLAERFTEEHHRALDWLNDHTEEGLAFYGVALDLWQIDESRPAVRFNVVSRPPAAGGKAAVAKASQKLTETKRLQLDFWTLFSQKLRQHGVVRSPQTPRPQYWFDVALGRSGFVLSNIANTYDNRIGVRLYLNNKVATVALEQLKKERDQIEEEIGAKLLWDPNPDNRDKVIVLHRDCDLSDRDGWPAHADWLVQQVAKFRKVFGPRIRKLDLSASTPP